MASINENNTQIDNNSGAVLYKRSPELIAITQLKADVDRLEKKVDRILELLERGADIE